HVAQVPADDLRREVRPGEGRGRACARHAHAPGAGFPAPGHGHAERHAGLHDREAEAHGRHDVRPGHAGLVRAVSTAKVGSIELYYEEHGSGEPLLLIMGLAADRKSVECGMWGEAGGWVGCVRVRVTGVAVH